MYRANALQARLRNSYVLSLRATRCILLGAFLLSDALQRPAHAITLNMTYFNEGDPVPHDENPSWDPAGVILKAHFQAAKAIWEYLLPGGGSYDIDFEWDDDIGSSTLGLTTPGPNAQTLDTLVEINPNQPWFADPTPMLNEEFSSTPIQSLYSQLSASDQSTYFPDTAPPGALETRYNLNGMAGIPGAGGFHAANGFDLLSTIVHELGHALGVNSEPGDYNIYPQHVGGLTDVTVLSGNGGHLAGNGTTPGFLMCDSCGTIGVRRLPTATDVLVVAEDQSITVVELARVGRISTGSWQDANGWIGGDVPDGTQDVYISHGGSVSLNALATAANLRIFAGNSVAAQSRQLIVPGTINFDGGALPVASGGSISANSIIGDPSALTTTAGSLVRFNQFTRGSSSGTAASFNGSLAIGYYIPSAAPTTFTPNPITNWTIAEDLKIGDESDATLVVNSGTWNVGGNVKVGNATAKLDIQGGSMTVGGNVEVGGNSLGYSDVTVEGGTLNVTGHVIARSYGRVTYKTSTTASGATFDIQGGATGVEYIPPDPAHFVYTPGGRLTIEGTANVVGSTFNVDGGTGNGAPSGLVVFNGDANTTASNAQIRTKGGHKGGTSPYLFGLETPGNGGVVRFEGGSRAWQATIDNEGGSEWYSGGGGHTIFADSSSATNATIHNHGATFSGGEGGATYFLNSSTAEAAHIFNHADGSNYGSLDGARTLFYDSSNAGTATIENEGAPSQQARHGRTEFHNNASAASATINNRGYPTVGDLAGRTVFYDNSTAANATLSTFNGYSDHGRIEFHNRSSAANSHIILDRDPTVTASLGGYLHFYDNSTAAQSEIRLRLGAAGGYGGIQFFNNATAANAQIVSEEYGGSIYFWSNSTADHANFSLGRGSINGFYDTSTAANATYTMRHGSSLSFQNNSSAGSAQIVAAGSSIYGIEGAAITFNTTSLVNNTVITLGGGTASLATGASAWFINGAHADNAVITANGGSNGGGGAKITFSNGYGDNARIIANAGSTVDFVVQPSFNNGSTSVGSIEGAGLFWLRGSLLTTGARDTSTTVSGPIVDNPGPNPFYSGGRLTKVGTGTLTLAGTNTYTGLTTVNAGTISVTGSIAGGAVVNSGSTLGGTGTIGGTVTVNSGGLLAPGTSAGALTAASATMFSGAALNIELGGATAGPQYDQLLVSGALTLDGALNVSLINGFIPSAGQAFNILDWGSLAGTFSSLNLPTLAGMSWNTSQLYSIGVLSVASAGLPGDFNNDGKVDAADYVVWRKNGGTPEGFNAWRANFGQMAAGGVGSGNTTDAPAAVPEPVAITLLAFATILVGVGDPLRRLPGRE